MQIYVFCSSTIASGLMISSREGVRISERGHQLYHDDFVIDLSV